MNSEDRKLGMNRNISRRDVLHGVGAIAAASFVPGRAFAEEMMAAGFLEEDVRRVVRLIDLNEYKRRQAPIGVRISRRAFGRDRRYPITWAWRSGE